MDLTLRHIEGQYEVLEKLGEGGMGAVYKVRHRLLDELRIVKLIRPQFALDEAHRRRFHREARLAVRLRHPNIAQLHDFSFDDSGAAYMVIEYIEGFTFEEVVARHGPCTIDFAVELARQMLEALRCLHTANLAHRDISPDNVMLSRGFRGDAAVKLIDLGLAKDIIDADKQTAENTFMGKARYAAPERFSPPQEDEPETCGDIYSFGLVFYELLTGQCAIAGKTFGELAASHLFKAPRDFADTDPESRVPDDLRQLVLDALEKDPKRRATVRELVDRLRPRTSPERSHRDETESILEICAGGHEPAKAATSGDAPTGELSTIRGSGLLEEARQLIDSGSVELAGSVLEKAMQLDPENPELGELQGELTAARLESSLSEAAFSKPWLESVLQRLQEARAAGLPSARFETLRDRVQRAYGEHAEALKRIDDLIEAEDLDAARRGLEELSERYADEPDVQSLESKLDAAVAKRRDQGQRADDEHAEALRRIEDLIEAEDLAAARQGLDDLSQRYADEADVQSLESKLDAAVSRRREELSRAVDTIANQIAGGRLAEARLGLIAALDRFGKESELEVVETLIEEEEAKSVEAASEEQRPRQKARDGLGERPEVDGLDERIDLEVPPKPRPILRWVLSAGAVVAVVVVVIIALLPDPPPGPRPPIPNPPVPPTGLNATAVDTFRIDVTWVDNSTDEENFIVERQAMGEPDFSVVDPDLPSGAEAYVDDTLDPETTYTYRIRASNPTGDSEPSGTASATTLALLPPSPPEPGPPPGLGPPPGPGPPPPVNLAPVLGEIDGLIGAGRWEEALQSVRTARSTHGANAEFDTREALAFRIRDDSRETANRISGLIDAGSFEEAERAIRSAESRFGSGTSGLSELRSELLNARNEAAVQFQNDLKTIDDLIGGGQLDDAGRAIEDAESNYGPGQELTGLRDSYRRAVLAAEVIHIGSLVDSESYPEAETRLGNAIDEYGEGMELLALQRRLDEKLVARVVHEWASARESGDHRRLQAVCPACELGTKYTRFDPTELSVQFDGNTARVEATVTYETRRSPPESLPFVLDLVREDGVGWQISETRAAEP